MTQPGATPHGACGLQYDGGDRAACSAPPPAAPPDGPAGDQRRRLPDPSRLGGRDPARARGRCLHRRRARSARPPAPSPTSWCTTAAAATSSMVQASAAELSQLGCLMENLGRGAPRPTPAATPGCGNGAGSCPGRLRLSPAPRPASRVQPPPSTRPQARRHPDRPAGGHLAAWSVACPPRCLSAWPCAAACAVNAHADHPVVLLGSAARR